MCIYEGTDGSTPRTSHSYSQQRSGCVAAASAPEPQWLVTAPLHVAFIQDLRRGAAAIWPR